MAIKYDSVVPWGRSYDEYLHMFDLSDADLNKRILGCGDGPASFNCMMTKMGRKVVSIDPIYELSFSQIEKRIEETYEVVIAQTRQNADKFVWSSIKSVDELGEIRMSAMKAFLKDFESGKAEGRYVSAVLPKLPFEDKQFELTLCSHFLFLYSENLSLDFHLKAIEEMLRVSEEVRIFPLTDMNAVKSSYVDEAVKRFTSLGYTATEKQVNYEFQKGSYKMLSIK